MTSSAFRQCLNISPYLSIDYIDFPQSWYVSTRYNITIYDCFQYLSLNTPLTLTQRQALDNRNGNQRTQIFRNILKPKLLKSDFQQP